MKRRRFITKRTCIVLMLLLVGGAIVNVAVAWGCFLAADPIPATPQSPTGRDLAWWSVDVPWGYSEKPDYFLLFHGSAIDYEFVVVNNTQIRSRSILAHHWQSGWPMRSLERSEWIEMPRGKHWRRHSLILGRDPTRALPLYPIWPGFAINTVFYAVILWGLFAAPFAIRRRRRIKRGWCPKCAYDLRGRPPAPTSTVCPECGGPVTPQLQAS